MCSICGGNYSLEIVEKASKQMSHRGPDYSGTFSDGEFCFAHNRLSIIDLDSEANQPFISPFCPHLVLVFNGEIYNYLEIKAQLQKDGIPFFTQSDTEVLLHAFFYYGVECLKIFNGDFAFAIYDTRNKSLFLARDRLGNKPLFYTLKNGKIFFASEIKAFLSVESFRFDLEEVSKWLLFGNGTTDATIYEGIYAFPKASFAWFKQGESALKSYCYWDFASKFDFLQEVQNKTESLDELENLLLDATKIRLRSDVPLALCVSGGIDSSILAHFVMQCSVNCKFFGLNFQDYAKGDESAYILQLASDLGISVELISPHVSDIKEGLHNLCYTQDEIFRSFSIFSQYLLLKCIAPYCKVSLSGQGADELFGGYYHHIGRYIFENFESFKERISVYGDSAFKEYNFGLKCALDETLKLKLFHEDNIKNIEKLIDLNLPIPSLYNLLERFTPNFTQGLWLDTITYNLPNLLRYEDRNAMAFGIENRTPFTDYRVVEFAFKLHKSWKIHKGYSKYILRLLLDKLGSKELAWRKDKIGFSAPEFRLMQTLGYNADSLFDMRLVFFEILKKRYY